MEITHTVEREIDIPSWIVIENHLDLDHIPHVHKRCYKYASIITRYQRKDGYHNIRSGVTLINLYLQIK